MQISGIITSYKEKPNTLLFSFAPDGDEKHEDLYANNKASQDAVKSLVTKHVTIDFEWGDKKKNSEERWKNIQSITESEAPKQLNAAQQAIAILSQPQTKETDWDMIGRQKARCSILQAAVQYCNEPPETVIEIAKKFEAYVFSPIPSSAPKTVEKAPESFKPANEAQIRNLKAKVKHKNDAELLSIAKYRYPDCKIEKLEDIGYEAAAIWLEEVSK